jgi:hypothetical protein
MIKGIASNSRYLEVQNGNPAPTHVYNSGNAFGVGNVRFNSSSQCMEVYDGITWQLLNINYTSIGLTSHAQILLDWADTKRREEIELEALAKKNPTVADLIEQKNNLDNKIKMVQILTKEESKIGTS